MSGHPNLDGLSGRQLIEIQRNAGAVFSNRHGPEVAIHYGSAAGELAVCVSAVGIVDRCNLTKLMIEGPPAPISKLLEHVVGGSVAPGGAVYAGGAWWCRAAAERVVALCDLNAGQRLREWIRAQTRRHAGIDVSDMSVDWAAIGLLGRNTPHVLRALGAVRAHDHGELPSFVPGRLGESDALWLLESDSRALALVPHGLAGKSWSVIEDAGRPYGVSCVGLEAAQRYELLKPANPVAAVSG